MEAFVVLLNVDGWVSVKGFAYTEQGAVRLCEKIARKDINMRRRFDEPTEWRNTANGVPQVLWYEKSRFVDTALDAMVAE